MACPSRLSSHLFWYVAGMLLIFLLRAFPFETSARVLQPKSPRLEIGKPIQTTISAGERHTYLIASTGNLFVEVVVDQGAADVTVTLFGPDGSKLVDADRTESYAPETIIGIMGPAGEYRAEVESVEKSAGKYAITLKALRPPREGDKERIDTMAAAFAAAAEGDELLEKGDPASLNSAIAKYTNVLALWRAAGDKHWEASTLRDIGSAYQLLGQKDKALANYSQALAIFQSIKNQGRQALTLGLMAKLLDSLNASSAERRKALGYHTQALSLLREIGDREHEVNTLNYIGLIYDNLGEHSTGLKYFNEALPLAKTLADRNFEAKTLYNTGRAYDYLSERMKALDYYNQALPIFLEVGNQVGQSSTLHNLGSVYHELGEMQKALEFYNKSLEIDRVTDDKLGQGTNINDIGGVYSDLGEKQKALEFYNRALILRRETGDRGGEAGTLNNIGAVYDSLGQRQTALDFYNQGLSVARQADDRDGEATTLLNIGYLYNSLGDTEKSLQFYIQALEIYRLMGDRSGEAVVLNNIGRANDDLGDRRKAMDLFLQALKIHHEIGDRGGEATTLNNLGSILYDLGDKQQALEDLNDAFALCETIGDLNGQATALNGIGTIYSDLGQKEKARLSFETAIVFLRLIGDRGGEAETLANLASEWKTAGKPLLALFYGKQSVNLFQILRGDIQNLNKDQQKTYLSKVEPTYRFVTDLLISQGRLAEAHQTLNLYRDQQFFDFNRLAESKASVLTLTSREATYVQRYEQHTARLADIFQQLRAVTLKIGEENAKKLPEYQALDKQRIDATHEFKAFLKSLETELAQSDPQKDKTEDIPDTRELQRSLRDLQAQTTKMPVVVYTTVGEDNFHALVVTPESIFAVSQAIKSDTLNEEALELWALLQSDKYDPSVLSQQLYATVFKPIEAQLPKETSTIVWMLDGNLRYVPMGALYDGKQYLVERYNHVVATRADRERLLRRVTAKWTGLGFGSSQAHIVELLGEKISFNSLPGVNEELQAVFKQQGSTRGLLDGEVLPDAKFTKVAMLNALKQHRPLVHISSHFSFRPGDEARSFLLLGDGTAMTLAEMKEHKDLFSGVELLTLSACNTAAQQAGANGREIDGFAELAQRLGAGSVMATLWPVADNSTPWLMREFYQTRENGIGLTKAEAFHRAQLALLNGTAQTKPLPVAQKGAGSSVQIVIGRKNGSNVGRSGSGATRAGIVYVGEKDAPLFKRDDKKPFAHPYYWAPFILIGNWK